MVRTLQRSIAILACTALAASGCATSGTPRVASAPNSNATNNVPSVMTEYVQKLPPGTEVRVARTSGRSLHGTLVKATDQSVFVQPKTRIAEPIVEIPMNDVVQVTPERHGGMGVGRAIGAGAAAGAAATISIFLIMFAIYGD